jgi:HK97 family phage prohead protease
MTVYRAEDATIEITAPPSFDPATLVRTFPVEVAEGDGRTLDTRIVPYNVPATVIDPPDPVPYEEVFLPGAFARQVANPDRVKVWLNFEHEQGLRGIVGHGIALRDQPDGLYGAFRMHENTDGDKALGFVNEGIVSGLSIEFAALRSRKTGDGLVQRLRAHISRVSLCRFPAYADARVLSVREEIEAAAFAEGFVDEHGAPREPTFVERLRAERAAAPLDPELVERITAYGIEPPLQRMAISKSAWDGSPARFSDEEYARSALICRAGDDPPKERCSLPVLEPSGALNVNALGAAAGALAGARGGLRGVSRAEKATAARKLVRYYHAAGVEPPPSLTALARS